MYAAGVNTVRTRLATLIAVLMFCLAQTFAVAQNTSSDTDSPELTDLIPKVYLAYGGKDSLAQLDKNYTMIGEQKVRTTEAEVVSHFRQIRRGTQLRIDIEPSGESAPISTVFDGISAWKAAGKVTEDLPETDAAVLSEERNRSPAVLVHFLEPGYTFKMLGRTTYRATPVHSIEVTKKGESPVTVFIDQKNYLVNGISFQGIDPNTKKSTPVSIDYLEYRPFGGTLFPFKQVHYTNDQPVLELAINTVDLTKDVDEAEFRRPDKPYEIRLAKPVIVPFEYSHKEILVKVSLNGGEPLDFLLDTGATQTVIDRRTAADHFLDRGPNFNIVAASGTVPTQMTSVHKVQIGDITISDVQALILDLTPQTRQIGKPISGIIGANVLNKFATTIDFSKGQLVFHDANTYKAAQGANLVPFTQKQSGPLVKAYLNGTQEVTFIVDTGAAFNNVPTKFAKPYISGQAQHTTEATGLDGRPVRLATVTIPSVRIGTQTARNVNFTYSVDPPPELRTAGKGFLQSNNTIGVLGNPFWQNFVLTMDYKFQRLVLQPNTVVTARQEIDQLISSGDAKLSIYRDLRAAENNYQKALMKAEALHDAKQQARIWGRIGNLRRIMAKDLNRPEQSRIAYEYFSKAQQLSHKLQDRESEGRILADWSLLYIDNGQMPAAQQALQGATLYAPQDPQVNVDFAVYLYKLQLYPEMQKYVEKALFLDPSNWQALWYKVKLAELFSDNIQLKSTLKEILRHYPWSKLAKDKLVALEAPQPESTVEMPPTN